MRAREQSAKARKPDSWLKGDVVKITKLSVTREKLAAQKPVVCSTL